MAFLIGMDEAGYGPNLGPLVVAATAWEVHADCPATAAAQAPLDEIDLYELLGDAVSRSAAAGCEIEGAPIAIADSKQLYRPGGGLALLERGLLAALAEVNQWPMTWRDLVRMLDADPRGAIEVVPWLQGFDLAVPTDWQGTPRRAVGSRLLGGERAARVVAVRARAVFAGEFNALCERHGNKAAALTRVTLELLEEVLETLRKAPARMPSASRLNEDASQGGSSFHTPHLPLRGPSTPQSAIHNPQSAISTAHCLVVCDKHGGRNRYGQALQRQFTETLVEIRGESRAESQYVFGPTEARVDVRFRRGGEAFLPTALASMTAKYVRELAMRAFNAFWQSHLPRLRPTAGYPVDAKRFKRDIAPQQAELGIDDRVLWRVR